MKKFNDFINEGHYDPYNNITYDIEIEILFAGFKPAILKFNLIFSNNDVSKEEIEKSVDERLKIFNNIVAYDIIKYEKASEKDQIYPMY